MKNLLMILVIILIVGFTLTNTTESRADWCKLLCEDIDYGADQTLICPGCLNGCSMRITFAYRYVDCEGATPPSYCDYIIKSIEILPLGCTPSPPTPSEFQIMSKAMEVILKAPGNSPCEPTPGQIPCPRTFSITFASCWYWDGIVGTSGPGTAVLKPCDETQCCRNIYEVCKDNFPPFDKHPTLVTTIGINPVCPSGECFNICEEFSQPPSIPSGIEKDYETGHNFKTSVFPNPSSDLINLKIESDTEGEFTIEINDVAGNIIVTKNIIKKQNEIQLQFKMSSFPNGNYYFVVKQNGKQVSSGTFNLVK